jgi:5-methylcytosine-specific restriction endonuclease McrA
MRTKQRNSNSAVLILNAAFEPISFADVKRAMKLIVKGKAVMVLENEERPIHKNHFRPSVVRLSTYRHLPHQRVLPRRDKVFLRDDYTCQYCFQEFPSSELTLDHVIPRAQGGLTVWENLVACCRKCNSTKADRTPEQAGMELLRKPRPMTIHTSRSMLRMMGSADPQWRQYLYH